MVYLNVERTEYPDDLYKFKTLDEAVEYIKEELEIEEDYIISTQPNHYEDGQYILIEDTPDGEKDSTL